MNSAFSKWIAEVYVCFKPRHNSLVYHKMFLFFSSDLCSKKYESNFWSFEFNPFKSDVKWAIYWMTFNSRLERVKLKISKIRFILFWAKLWWKNKKNNVYPKPPSKKVDGFCVSEKLKKLWFEIMLIKDELGLPVSNFSANIFFWFSSNLWCIIICVQIWDW